MQKLDNYHELNPGRRYAVLWEWNIDDHEVAYGTREVDWDNGQTHKSPAVFCDCDLTCEIIDGHLNIGGGRPWPCPSKEEVFELGIVGARERYGADWSVMTTEDAVVDIMTRAANLEWLGQRDRHISPAEMSALLAHTDEAPKLMDVIELYRCMAAAEQIKTIANHWFYVDPTIAD